MRFLIEHVFTVLVVASLLQFYRNELFSFVSEIHTLDDVLQRVRETSALTWLQFAIGAFILAFLGKVFLKPYQRFMPLPEGHAQKSRKRGTLPPPYPNGWFHLLNSNEIQRGEVREIEALGHHLAVFRGQNGKVSVLDAYCPHLGANLCHGGEVKDNCLVCPFHGWAFDGEGTCVNIPYSENIPSVARTQSWATCERNGGILVWHHAEGQAPEWEVPVIDVLDKGEFVCHGSTQHHVGAHCQEIPENGADVAHLNHLHVPFLSKILGAFFHLEHSWNAHWQPGVGEEAFLSHIRLSQSLRCFGIIIPGTKIDVEINQVGPGVVNLHFFTPFGQMYTVETVTPMKPLQQRCTHTMWATWRVPRWFAKFVLASLCIQFERDVPIWNHKQFLSRPLVVKTDGPITQFRRWYQKFYSKGSHELANKALDW